MKHVPKLREPMANSMQPLTKVRKMTKSMFVSRVNSLVSRAIKEVAPIDISLTEPNIA